MAIARTTKCFDMQTHLCKSSTDMPRHAWYACDGSELEAIPHCCKLYDHDLDIDQPHLAHYWEQPGIDVYTWVADLDTKRRSQPQMLIDIGV